jgi:hypothetical protein
VHLIGGLEEGLLRFVRAEHTLYATFLLGKEGDLDLPFGDDGEEGPGWLCQPEWPPGGIVTFSFEWIKKSGGWLMRKESSVARPSSSLLIPEPGVAWTLLKGTATLITLRMASITSMAITRAMGLMGLLLVVAPSPRELSPALKGFARIPPAASYPLDLDILFPFPYSPF